MENPKNLQSQPEFCYNCMTRLEDGQTICPACGHDSSVRQNPRNALPEGTILEGKYLIGKVLGRGGFGITYLGYDLALTVRTAIKEYFPAGIGVRSSDLINVVPASSLSDKGSFQKGCNEFQNEAQSLARFNSPNIVHVREYFRANGTAYIVMDYVEESSLAKELEQSGGRMSWERTVDLFKPLILELKKLHEEHLIHRDIKPDNIYLAKDPKSGQERLVLLDFGSARQFISENITKTYTTTVTPGYAPIEQYSEKGHQGPYTDVYALSATMYTAITGIKPANAADRSVGSDRIVPIHEMEIPIPEGVESAVMHGLEVRKEDRPQTMQKLYDELTNGTNQNKKAEEKHITSAVSSKKQKSDNAIAPSGGQKKTGLILLAGAAVIIAFAGLFLLLSRNNTKPVLNDSEQTQTAVSVLQAELVRTQTAVSDAQIKTEAAAELEAAGKATQEVIAFVQTEIAETQQAIDEEQTKAAVPDVTDTPEPTPIKAEEAGEPEVSEPENLLKVGELIKFGSYEQDNNLDNGAEEIEWQVLHVENGRALLISKYCLDAKPYHDDPYAEVTWEESTMRKWLNEDFYLNAFSEDEKIKIVMVTNKNPDNPVYATDGGNDTEDRIFLLSADEAEKYFADDEARKCEATAYAKEMGAVVYDYNEFTGAEYGGTSRWRLRTPGYQAFNVVYVDESGSIYNKTGNVGIVSDGAAVRPALWLDLAAEKLVY